MKEFICWEALEEDEVEKEKIEAECAERAANKYAWRLMEYYGEEREYDFTIAVEDGKGEVRKWHVLIDMVPIFHPTEITGADA